MTYSVPLGGSPRPGSSAVPGSAPESGVRWPGAGARTKRDLARAYVDMGDAEMGRALLGEVLVESTPEQQAEARTLLSRIG